MCAWTAPTDSAQSKATLLSQGQATAPGRRQGEAKGCQGKREGRVPSDSCQRGRIGKRDPENRRSEGGHKWSTRPPDRSGKEGESCRVQGRNRDTGGMRQVVEGSAERASHQPQPPVVRGSPMMTATTSLGSVQRKVCQTTLGSVPIANLIEHHPVAIRHAALYSEDEGINSERHERERRRHNQSMLGRTNGGGHSKTFCPTEPRRVKIDLPGGKET